MANTVPVVFFACCFILHSATAELIFARFFTFDPITEFDFEYRTSAPVVEVVYVRSRVGESVTGITVTLDDPDFRILGHSCPTTLSNGRSCMIFFSFDPERAQSTKHPHDGVFSAQLNVSSSKGVASLKLSGHRNSRYCEERRLPFGAGCSAPEGLSAE